MPRITIELIRNYNYPTETDTDKVDWYGGDLKWYYSRTNNLIVVKLFENLEVFKISLDNVIRLWQEGILVYEKHRGKVLKNDMISREEIYKTQGLAPQQVVPSGETQR